MGRADSWHKSRHCPFWRLTDEGTYDGVELPMYVPMIRPDQTLTRSMKLVELYVIGTDLLPPSDLYRIAPADFLLDCEFMGLVVTSSKNSQRMEKHLLLHRSVVRGLLRRESGQPPILRKRRGL